VPTSLRAVAFVLAQTVGLAALSGCTSARYVTQAAAGQEQLNGRGVSISEVVSEQRLDKRTRSLLAHVAPIKAFGERHGLRKTNNYERYVRIGRPAVVWVVSASDPVRFRPRTWKFPVVGSITYTGWFDPREARSYAHGLEHEGWDVDVRPSQAYSTLGWFDDPILSTMVGEGPEALGDLADVVLHETLHATFYIPGQSTLNESMASFVGDTLSVQYLDEALGPGSAEKEAFLGLRARGEVRGAMMRGAYEELAMLYASRRPRAEKLAEKKRIIDALRVKLEIRRPLTNATFIQYRTYGSGKPEMAELWKLCGGSLPRMLAALERARAASASAPPHTDPALLLRPVIAGGCE
jgi:predicted aminopeptidase